ncbi:unnamed protein product, partial [Closterium sp. NIES-54]
IVTASLDGDFCVPRSGQVHQYHQNRRADIIHRCRCRIPHLPYPLLLSHS